MLLSSCGQGSPTGYLAVIITFANALLFAVSGRVYWKELETPRDSLGQLKQDHLPVSKNILWPRHKETAKAS